MTASQRMMTGAAALSMIFVSLAMLRPIDHDESQYVAAAVMTAHGLLPYRDYAYLQTPLQPFVFAPVAALAGSFAWPALRIVNALLGAVGVIAVAGAAQAAGASRRVAMLAAGLFATTDVLLFSIGTARNDALPAACLAVALWLALRPNRRAIEAGAIGLLLAAATAAKVSYAIPAIAYGLYALVDRTRRPGWVVVGAVPLAMFVAWTAWLAPHGFWFGVFDFPSAAPDQYYRTAGRLWKLSLAAKAIDTVKFLAIGPALFAIVMVVRQRPSRRPTLAEGLILAGLIAALLPTPTWRQYLLPMMPPLFVALGIVWTRRPPGRAWRVASVIFAAAGIAPSVAAIAQGGGMATAIRDGAAIRNTMEKVGARSPVATLSPQFIPATARTIDPRFATGPFYLRSHGLLALPQERALILVSRDTLAAAALPPTVLTGGEGHWTSGDPVLDGLLAARAQTAGYQPIAVPGGRFTIWLKPHL